MTSSFPGRGVLACLAMTAFLLVPSTVLHARPDDDAAAPATDAAEPIKPKRKLKPVKKVETPQVKTAPAADAAANKGAGGASLAAQAAVGAPVPTDVAAALKGAGIGRCADAIDAAAAPSMVGVTQSNMISTWSNIQPLDKHVANVIVGQRYGNNAAVPFGATAIIASPAPSGACDLTVLQVVSSPLPCASVRATLGKGKRMADLAGLTLIQDGPNNTLLMPTGNNTCVLIDYKASFAP